MKKVFLDTETFGLDMYRHPIWEVAWAVDDGPVHSGVLLHDPLAQFEEEALHLNGYRERGNIGDRDAALSLEANLYRDLIGATVVGSNPAFDTYRLAHRWRHSIHAGIEPHGYTPWEHRVLDLSAYAMGILAHDRPRGLAYLVEDLRRHGYRSLPDPDHTAAGDVALTRRVYRALQEEAER